MSKRILIEPLMFGDYFVAVYDDRNILLLDKKYFTSGFESALLVARELKKRDYWLGLEIYYFDVIDEKEKIIK